MEFNIVVESYNEIILQRLYTQLCIKTYAHFMGKKVDDFWKVFGVKIRRCKLSVN